MSSNSTKSNTFPVPRNANTPKSNNPFASNQSSSSSSRFGSSSSSRFSSSRFSNRQEVQWTVTPSAKQAVRISLKGLGDPIYRLLGQPISPDLTDIEKLVLTLKRDEELHERLVTVLDEAWETYQLRGAILVYPWDENIKSAFTGNIEPSAPPPKQEKSDKDNKDEDEFEDYLEEDSTTSQPKHVHTLRAIDTAFVLNILGRTRANVLVGNTPLALETGFLNRVIICDDARVLKLAQATGCIEEEW